MKCHVQALLFLVSHHQCAKWIVQGQVLIRPEILRNLDSVRHWGYEQRTDEYPPQEWEMEYPACKGARQSPIPINTAKTSQSTRLEPLLFRAYTSFPQAKMWTVVNNGHSVQLSGSFNSKHLPSVRKGGLPSVYGFTQLHFHWGSASLRGSEHVINNKRFPLELHIVHRKRSENDAEAQGDATGLAVVGILFELTADQDKALKQMDAVVETLSKVVNPNKPVNVTLDHLTLSGFLPPSTGYYRYLGSLTTPPCAEVVEWSVMEQPLKITEQQLNAFRRLHEGSGLSGLDLGDNFRPLQAPYRRMIEHFSGTKLTSP